MRMRYLQALVVAIMGLVVFATPKRVVASQQCTMEEWWVCDSGCLVVYDYECTTVCDPPDPLPPPPPDCGQVCPNGNFTTQNTELSCGLWDVQCVCY